MSGVSAGSSNGARGVIMHELGHVLGAAHVTDPAQLMFGGERTPSPGGPSGPLFAGQLGAGDRAGLAALGKGPCAPGV